MLMRRVPERGVPGPNHQNDFPIYIDIYRYRHRKSSLYWYFTHPGNVQRVGPCRLCGVASIGVARDLPTGVHIVARATPSARSRAETQFEILEKVPSADSLKMDLWRGVPEAEVKIVLRVSVQLFWALAAQNHSYDSQQKRGRITTIIPNHHRTICSSGDSWATPSASIHGFPPYSTRLRYSELSLFRASWG